MPLEDSQEPAAAGMLGNTKHDTIRLMSAADATCIVKYELTALLLIFKATSQVAAAFWKNAGAVVAKMTRLADLRAIAARDLEGRLVRLVKERSSSALASQRAGRGCSAAARSGVACAIFEAAATMQPETVLRCEQGELPLQKTWPN
jgi:hypothetical protein